MLLEVWSATDGHAVVVDGYQVFTDSTSQVHVNLGWGGAYTGWYDITNNWSTGYNWIASTQVAYRGIEPDDGVESWSGRSSPPRPRRHARPGGAADLHVGGGPRRHAVPRDRVPGLVRPGRTRPPGRWSTTRTPSRPTQAGCGNNIGNCSWVADGTIPAAVPTAFTVGATNDIDPDWDDASPYLQFTIARVGAPSASEVGQTSATMSAPVHPNGSRHDGLLRVRASRAVTGARRPRRTWGPGRPRSR